MIAFASARPAHTEKQVDAGIEEAPPVLEPPQTANTQLNEVSMVAVGDICLGRFINAEMVERDNFTFPFEHVRNLLNEADIAVGNLEAQLFSRCPVLDDGMRLCASNRAIDGLVQAGFDVVSVANNHSDNFGDRALAASVRTLRENGIAVAGYDRTPVIERRGTRFAFLAYDITKRVVSLKRIAHNISAARDRADVVVLILHWGREYETTPHKSQISLARFAASKGADLIIGAHPHVVQPLTQVNGTHVAYSLGNFVFDSMRWSEPTKHGAAARIVFRKAKIHEARLIPVELISPGIPVFADE